MSDIDFTLFSDDELVAISRGGHCAVEAWLHVKDGHTEVTHREREGAIKEMRQRMWQRYACPTCDTLRSIMRMTAKRLQQLHIPNDDTRKIVKEVIDDLILHC